LLRNELAHVFNHNLVDSLEHAMVVDPQERGALRREPAMSRYPFG
jgi:hypothetical protein